MERKNDGRFYRGQAGRRKPDEEIQQLSSVIHKERYRFLGREEGDAKTGIFSCREHKTVFKQNLASHLQGRTPDLCPQCIFQKRSTTTKNSKADWSDRKKHPRYFSDEAISKISLENFKGRYKFVRRDEDHRYGYFKCPHGKTLRQVIYQHKKKVHPTGCLDCLHEVRTFTQRSDEEIRDIGFSHFEGRVQFIRRVPGNKKYGEVICMEHGTRFTQSVAGYIKGRRACHLCRHEASRLHTKVHRALSDKFGDADIIAEKKFEDCRNKFQLRFDFYIPQHDLLVECDGAQHFLPSEFWGGGEGLEVRINNDRIKDSYAKARRINLLRIAFYEEGDIDEIIENAKTLLLCNNAVYRIHGNRLPGTAASSL